MCFLLGLWRTFRYQLKTGNLNHTVSGHTGKVKEIHENCSVAISYCTDCGKREISWTHGTFSEMYKEQMVEKGDCHCLHS